MSEKQNNDNNLADAGALWEKDGKNGSYFTGFVTIEGMEYPVIIFSNSKATHPQAPTHRVYLRTDQDPKPAKVFAGGDKAAGGGRPSGGAAAKGSYGKPAAAKAPAKKVAPPKDPTLDPDQEDDIPF